MISSKMIMLGDKNNIFELLTQQLSLVAAFCKKPSVERFIFCFNFQLSSNVLVICIHVFIQQSVISKE